MFGKNKDILNEVGLIRGKVTYMEDTMNNMARNVDDELVNIKYNQRKLENKLDKILSLLSKDNNIEESKEDSEPHFKFPHTFLPNKPSVPEYEMDKKELDNDLLTQGKYKQKTNFTIKSTEIDLTKVDWDKSYILLSFKGMTDYCLTLKQNNRSFSKFSDNRESLEITQLSKLVLYIKGQYLEIDLNLSSYDDLFYGFISGHDSGNNWNYTKFVINLD
ncbi:hypothetical protein [uncultured Megamonas sp.]|uniref:hypothetical protein n=1 Tax=uncultured Megamonas sp. TaxID=286140 RepID=UPI00259BD194|nr:hypothetical protein [uncultured Megamonas sp.]